MSFADSLKEMAKRYDSSKVNNERVNNIIERSFNVIKKESKRVAASGKYRLDGFIYLYGDSEYILEKSKEELGSCLGILYEFYTKDEEIKIIEGIRDKVKDLGFDSWVIENYHPKRVADGFKKVGTAIFNPQRSIPVYRHTDGFCIEIHMKW